MDLKPASDSENMFPYDNSWLNVWPRIHVRLCIDLWKTPTNQSQKQSESLSIVCESVQPIIYGCPRNEEISNSGRLETCTPVKLKPHKGSPKTWVWVPVTHLETWKTQFASLKQLSISLETGTGTPKWLKNSFYFEAFSFPVHPFLAL